MTPIPAQPARPAVAAQRTPRARSAQRLPLMLATLAASALLLWFVSVRQAASLLVGVGLGATLAGARFGFTTGWRQLALQRDPRGVVGQLLLLGAAALLAMPLLGRFAELQAALGPPSVSLLVGAFVFGLCMQVADGCGSGTLYKAGLGLPLNMAILPLFALGSFIGSLHLHGWLALGQIEPVGLVERWGVGPALAATLAALLILGLAARGYAGWARPWLQARWLWGAGALALLATLNLVLAGQPWGVVYGLGLWGAKLAQAAGLFDPAANAFWSQAGHAQRLTQTLLLDVTSITNTGILIGALWVAAGEPPAKPAPLTGHQWAVGLLAGFLMGYSARLAFGCNVGAMLSGISTGSLHGWLWVPLAFAGTLVGLRVRRHFGL